MKQILLLSFIFFFGTILFAQQQNAGQENIYPESVSKAKFFDKSKPLRDVEPIVPGVRRRAWKNDEVINPSMQTPPNENVQVENENLIDPAVQKEVYSNEIYWPLRNVMGLGNVNGVFPPDTDGEVGLNHYFLMINSSFAIYDKAGIQLYGPADNSTLWEGFDGPWSGTNDGDPIVLYDEQADRWFASQFALPNFPNGPFYQLIAISETGDPLGAWYRYAFSFSKMNDYPKFGVWHNAYLGTFNFFNAGSTTFAGGGTVVFERDAMLVGNPDSRMITFAISSSKYGILPADFDGTPPPASEPAWFAHMNRTGNKNLEIWKALINWDDPGSSTYSMANSLVVSTFNASVSSIPQPNTSQTLDAIGGQLMFRLQYRNFGSYSTLVANHTVTANSRASIRWYELRKTATDWSVYQQSTFSPDNDYRWMGSIAMNANGNIAIGYGVSSSTTFPSIRYVGRTANAPLNTLNIPECVIIDGASSQTNINRWGDYSSMSIDPADDSTFWYSHMYRLSSNWRTQFASFNFAPGVPPQVDAGPDQTMCISASTISTKASAIAIVSVLWTSAGDGMLLYTNRLQTLYAPGQNDRLNGSVVLTCEVTGWNGDVVSDQMTIFINDLPQVNAGNDTLICQGESLQLHGTAQYIDSSEWQTAGDGTFSDITDLNAIYTPGNQDILNGTVVLTLNAFATEVCVGQDTDNMLLTVDICNAIGENPVSFTPVQITPNPNNGRFKLIIDNELKEKISWEISLVNNEIIQKHTIRANVRTLNEDIDLSNYPAGTYIIQVTVGNKTYSERIVVNK